MWGWVWIEFIVAPGQILSILPRMYIQFWSRFDKTPAWAYDLAKPFFECAVCHAGWLTIILHLDRLEIFSYYGFMAVTVSMVTAFFVTKWAEK